MTLRSSLKQARIRAGLSLTDAARRSVVQRPNIAAYLGSPRRVAFNTQGIFRHYPELDG